MITVTDAAREKVLEAMAAEGPEARVVRLAVADHGPRGLVYSLNLETDDDRQPDDTVVDCGGFTMLIDKLSAPRVAGVTMDFVQRGLESGFAFDHPGPRWSDPLAQAVQDVLDREVNPAVAGHGGYVRLLDVRDATAFIALGGGCQGCGMVDVTLKQGVEVAIRQAVPEIARVLDTTDHAAGENPFFSPAHGGDSPFS
jgi:Fe/S biogenesis protein NfuA